MTSDRIADKGRDETFERNIKQVLMLQAAFSVAALALIVIYYVATAGSAELSDSPGGMFMTLKATGYGALLGMINTILSGRSVRGSSRAVLESPQFAMMPVYMGFLYKLVIVGGGIAIGLVVLGLKPIFVVMGYFVAQAAFIWASVRFKTG